LVSGALPPGLTFETGSGIATATISGTPTATGAFPITIGVRDATTSTGAMATRSFTLVVSARVVVTTSNLPAGSFDAPYAATVQASGGIAPYSWGIVFAKLPQGLTLDAGTGAISGTPQEGGTFFFTVEAIDAGLPHQRGTKTLSITVGGHPPLRPTAFVTTGNETVVPIDLTTNQAGPAIETGALSGPIGIKGDASDAWAILANDNLVPIDTTSQSAGPQWAVPTLGYPSPGPPQGPLRFAPSQSDRAYTGIVDIDGFAGSWVEHFDPGTSSGDGDIIGNNEAGEASDIALTSGNRIGYAVLTNGDPVLSLVPSSNLGQFTYEYGQPFVGSPSAYTMAVSADGATGYLVGRGPDWSQISGMSIVDLATGAQVAAVACDCGEVWTVELAPDGARAYVLTSTQLIPIDLVTRTVGPPISTGPGSSDLAIAPDGRHAYVVNNGAGNVTIYNLATGGLAATVTGLNAPQEIVITPDQAPVAKVSVTPQPAGDPTTFDASASTVRYGTIASYEWNFGDGTIVTTPGPETEHTYAVPGQYTVTLTETSSGGTSTTQVFTGHDMLRNGGPSARETETFTVPGEKRPSATVVTSSMNPSAIGDPVTFTATVNTAPPGATDPTGTIQFSIDGQPLGAPAPLAGGKATSPSVSDLALGAHAVEATYSGDDVTTPSTGKLSQSVGPDATATEVSSSHNPSAYSQAVIYTATVKDAGPDTPTGAVTFSVDGTQVCDEQLADGSATCQPESLLDPGSHEVVGDYAGGTDFSPSTGSLVQQVVKAATGTEIESDVNPSKVGQAVTFSAQVTVDEPGGGAPTGTVQFLVGDQPLGSAVPVNDGMAAAPPTTALPAGIHAITAFYSGDTGHFASRQSLFQTVEPPIYQPDAAPREFGDPVGRFVYTPPSPIEDQTVGKLMSSNKGIVYRIPFYNNSTVADSFMISAEIPTLLPGYTVEIRESSTKSNVTSEVLAGTYEVGPIAPDQSTSLQVLIFVPRAAVRGVNQEVLLTATSVGDPTKSDTGRFFVGPK
jgi:PKD repeat protein